MLRLSSEKGDKLQDFRSYTTHIGGSEGNVAVALSHWGIKSSIVSKVPDNPLGMGVINELKKHSVSVDNVVKGGNRLGAYYLQPGIGHFASQVIYDRAYSAFSEMEITEVDWDTVFANIDWFHWSGITPAISKSAYALCKKAVFEASKRGVIISVDLNYRKKLWNYGILPQEIIPELVELCDVVVGNEGHNHLMLSIPPVKSFGFTHKEDYPEVCQRVMEKFPKVKTVAFTVREVVSASSNKLHGVLCRGNEKVVSEMYTIDPIVDRIGGGDAFMAGLIYGIINQWDSNEIVNFATSACVLKHYQNGDFLVADEATIKLLYNANDLDVIR